jgi:8-oxo-dGTP pyrophosphatase MutT (NUDIX family)
VVVRRRAEDFEVVLVHRRRYRDWTFPKGKAHPGESDEECALREVEEETGLRCELGEEFESTTYHDSKGREKVVRYWRMRVLEGELHPHNEIDAAEWIPLEDAVDRLSYRRDREVLEPLLERVW